MKIINLFAGIGGNRMLWDENNEVTAVEIEPLVADFYKKRFPGDRIIIGDAYKYFEKHYEEYDMMWASPPCQTHTKMVLVRNGQKKSGYRKGDIIKMPDMRLYSLIIFCKYIIEYPWIIENVTPYYKPLVKPTSRVGRHYIWSNISIIPLKQVRKEIYGSIKKCCEVKGLDYQLFRNHYFGSRKQGIRRERIINNMMNKEYGKYIMDCILNEI